MSSDPTGAELRLAEISREVAQEHLPCETLTSRECSLRSLRY